jgi:hypothetical protein
MNDSADGGWGGEAPQVFIAFSGWFVSGIDFRDRAR